MIAPSLYLTIRSLRAIADLLTIASVVCALNEDASVGLILVVEGIDNLTVQGIISLRR